MAVTSTRSLPVQEVSSLQQFTGRRPESINLFREDRSATEASEEELRYDRNGYVTFKVATRFKRHDILLFRCQSLTRQAA